MPASPAQRAAAAARREQAVALRLAGVDYETIADKLGYANRGNACQDVARAMSAHQEQMLEVAGELKAVDTMRLDRMQAAIWGTALGGDLFAIDRVLRIMERRAKMYGLDAATKVSMEKIQALADALMDVDFSALDDTGDEEDD